MENSVRINFIGDFCSGGEYEFFRKKRKVGFHNSFYNISSLLQNSDLLVLNFEGPISIKGKKREDVTCHLYNDSSILQYLKRQNRCVLNMGNNHIMDYGNESLAETIDEVKRNKIDQFGAGLNREEAWKELIIVVKKKRIAFLAYSTNERNVKAVIADSHKAGCASYLEKEKVIEKIKYVKNRADCIIVSLHWGFEYHHFPSHHQKQFAHLLVDAGADIIFGHHPHVIQGIEKYKNAVIMYSLGNFFFPPVRNSYGRLIYQKKASKEFMIVNMKIDEKNRIAYTCLSGKMNKKYILELYDKRKQVLFDKRFDFYSSQIKESNFEFFWKQYRRKRKKELKIENIIEVLIKLIILPPREYLFTFRFRDILRNIYRMINLSRK